MLQQRRVTSRELIESNVNQTTITVILNNVDQRPIVTVTLNVMFIRDDDLNGEKDRNVGHCHSDWVETLLLSDPRP